MQEFNVNKELERSLVKTVRKNTSRWKVCNVISCVFGLVGIVLVALVLNSKELSPPEMLASAIAVLLIPVLGILISSAIARTSGRDILLARIGERVYISDEELIESYTPRFKEIDPSTLVENHILMSHITEIEYEKKMCRYLIYGYTTTTKQDQFEKKGRTVSEEQLGKIVLYDYFSNMSLLMNLIEQYSGKNIKEVE